METLIATDQKSDLSAQCEKRLNSFFGTLGLGSTGEKKRTEGEQTVVSARDVVLSFHALQLSASPNQTVEMSLAQLLHAYEVSPENAAMIGMIWVGAYGLDNPDALTVTDPMGNIPNLNERYAARISNSTRQLGGE